MRTVTGTPHNFPASTRGAILGTVATTQKDEESQSFLIETDSETLPYIVLSNGLNPTASSPVIHYTNHLELTVGDILQVFPSGRAIIVYQSTSDDNALFFTNACNSRCLMCPQPPKSKPTCFVDYSSRIIDLIKESPKVLGITGGEPTIFWDDLINMIDRIRDRHPETFLHILTNARLLNDAKKAKQLVEATGENAMFCVPLYSDDERTHNHLVGNESFWQTMEGVYNLGNEMANIEIRNVILKQNAERLNEYGEFIYRNIPFAKHIALMGMEPIGLARENFNRLWIAPPSYMPSLQDTVLRLQMKGMYVSIYNHPHCVLPPKLWDFSAPSISDWKIRYYEACKNCAVADQCGGVFFSARKAMTPYIKSVPEAKANGSVLVNC